MTNKAIDFRISKNESQHHLIIDIDIDLDVVIDIFSKIGTVVFIVSFIAACVGVTFPFFDGKSFFEMTNKEIAWIAIIQIVSAVYIYLVVRYRRKFKYIVITKNGEKLYQQSPIK
ncbi:MAG: hypothetical protein UR85_C0008G0008 [Candidatus Nomurabacteria bacterium GW2011_GWF2_35_66]|uniref:Uncharacterized protein n=1 Tax=Candidatus Nomurabacteria bacterium GW2011_GWE1_35_16 TaxID=1618761 RepID=A0A0G0B9Y8_9BACT|nr:MAG: hypothetical protein UR55_C0011G0008 [Candidatus Nomurabacteria bacterium GW2011_GWF1_34_20]KKP62844.1 MAG: hypothetical protein UR57_C0010G0008 [Candidatus Nomurabacteria bacterium GW2011_GWE2_34_25]KKP66243.1 MAG: hypothetical protein UR64_C0010G0008 [Candidatus Nomurabacteria bacterium GW2011_GWE1_35_16]KKP83075.1 MAG: hypothetical protein UR85_C0008G0008 [Candidatus Nomurabacteria bacterium GW2011_GWF2_35_66]HAE36670.1 hypothetical protein [Candidatus Nomurabacteria bacterium]